MRRFLLMIFILSLGVLCGIFHPLFLQSTPTLIESTPRPSATIAPTSSKTTNTPTTRPSPLAITSTSTPGSTAIPSEIPFTVLYHPDDVLYVGDQVSLEVISAPGMDLEDATVQVQVDPPGGPDLDSIAFGAWGIQGREEATFLWAWDTSAMDAGAHTLRFSVQPQGYAWTEQVTLQPSDNMPPAEANTHWASTQTQCCTVFYITNTASERDISTLTTLIDDQAKDAIEKMGAEFTQPITITVLPRLLGHGGFTSDEISVSYLDRNYASNSWALVVHHEMVHAIDGHLGSDFRPSIFVEGLAVYMTGGHYKAEPLMPRAAALLDNSLYLFIPLKTLSNDFYGSQHEVGYLEGASLIEYMVKTYGWEAFSSFYRDMHLKEGESSSDAIDAALQAHFSITFDQLEQEFKIALSQQPDASVWVDDVRLIVSYYDTMRQYQQLLDPSAYFRTAWLLDNKSMRERGIVADYLRHPHTPVNLALETLFINAGQQLSELDYSSVKETLGMINSVLDAIENGTSEPFSVSPLAADYLSISTFLLQHGYEVQSIDIRGDFATTKAVISNGPELITVNLEYSANHWSIIP